MPFIPRVPPGSCRGWTPAGNQSWIFIRRTDAEAEVPILWPPDVKDWLIGKDPDSRKDWRQEEKGMNKDEMVGWHHWLDGHEFEKAPGVGDGQGGLACCSPWGCRESDTTQWLNWTEMLFTSCLLFNSCLLHYVIHESWKSSLRGRVLGTKRFKYIFSPDIRNT